MAESVEEDSQIYSLVIREPKQNHSEFQYFTARLHPQGNWTSWVQQTVIRWCWLCSVAEWTDRSTEPIWSFKPTSLLTAAAGKWSPMSRFSNWSNSSRDAGKDSSGTRYRRSFCSVHSRNRYLYSGKLRNTFLNYNICCCVPGRYFSELILICTKLRKKLKMNFC